MRLKEKSPVSTKTSRIDHLRQHPWRRRFIGIVLGLLLLAGVGFASIGYGIKLHRTGRAETIYEAVHGILRSPSSAVSNYFKGFFSDPEHITIDINYKNYQKLAYNRAVAMDRDVLLSDCRDWVPASVHYKNKSIGAKLRLKGDLHDHWRDEQKWSFRIRLKDDNTFLGMKEFSIQHPMTRSYMNEWVLHKLLNYCGLIASRYDFITVTLNGKNLGVYAIEEHAEKRLIEHNNRREGVILKLNDFLFWAQLDRRGIDEVYSSAPIDAFGMNRILADPQKLAQFKQGRNLLELFRRGELKTHEVFDIKKTARLFAVIDLLGHRHATGYANMRLYYNPVTSLIEGVGFDNQIIKNASLHLSHGSGMQIVSAGVKQKGPVAWKKMFFADEVFFAQYMKELENVSHREFLDTFFDSISEDFDRAQSVLYKDFPWYRFEGKKILYENQKYIKSLLHPVQAIQAYLRKSSPDSITLELGNIQPFPVEIIDVTYQGAETVVFQPRERFLLSGKQYRHLVEFHIGEFLLPEGFTFADSMTAQLKVNHRLLGIDQLRSESVYPWPHLDEEFLAQDFIRQKPNLAQFKFFQVDDSIKEIYIKSGSWLINKNLIIPPGYRVICGPATEFNLTNSAKILSYSPLEFVGSKDRPILIHSEDSTGQGLLVLNAPHRSLLQYVNFSNLSQPQQGHWQLTGAVTFYEAPVDISHCQFIQNRCEDGLNIIRSDFSIDTSYFAETSSDALDADFVIGKITNTSFVNCGNDAIDVSGSRVRIRDVFINGSGDKGISAGENSQMNVKGLEIKNAEIAAASKDLSQLSITDVKISDCKIGFTVYKKKPEFGPSTMHLTNLQSSNIELPYLIEEQSTLTLDGNHVGDKRKDVEKMLYGAQYGKSSK